MLGLNLGLSLGGGDKSSLPYTADPNLFAWDFTSRELNGGNVLRVPEMSRGDVTAWEQTVAASQPGAVAEGAQFVTGGAEFFDLASPIPLNASEGIYSAILFKLDAAASSPFRLLKLYDPANPLRTGRYRINFANTAARRPESFIDLTDSNANVRRISPVVTIAMDTWYVLEHFHDFRAGAADPALYWQDGATVAPNLINAFAQTSYPASDSTGGILGDNIEGIIKAMAVFDGVIPSDIRQSVSDWMVGLVP